MNEHKRVMSEDISKDNFALEVNSFLKEIQERIREKSNIMETTESFKDDTEKVSEMNTLKLHRLKLQELYKELQIIENSTKRKAFSLATVIAPKRLA